MGWPTYISKSRTKIRTETDALVRVDTYIHKANGTDDKGSDNDANKNYKDSANNSDNDKNKSSNTGARDDDVHNNDDTNMTIMLMKIESDNNNGCENYI